MNNFIFSITLLFSFKVYSQLVEIETVDKSIKKSIQYFSNYNFVGEIIDGYKSSKCFLVEGAANALSLVQKELNKQNFSLLIYDCYRPQKAVDHFIKWSKTKDKKMKIAFYPRLRKQDLFKLGYIAKKSGHTTGRSLDLTVI